MPPQFQFKNSFTYRQRRDLNPQPPMRDEGGTQGSLVA